MSECLDEFKRQTTIGVAASYGDSAEMFARTFREKADILVLADVTYIQKAEDKDVVASRKTLCYVTPVIVVPKGNPKNIKHVSGLGRSGVRFYLIDAEQCQTGILGERILAEQGVDPRGDDSNRISEIPEGESLSSMFAAGDLNAALVWRHRANKMQNGVEITQTPALAKEVCPVVAVSMSWCDNKDAAGKLMDFLAGPQGRTIFARHGFTLEKPAEGVSGPGHAASVKK